MADLLSGYNIVQRIGTGARSQIYEVVHPQTGQRYALKRVIREPHEDDRFLVQAITEYEVACKFEHPTLRKAFDCHRIKKWMRLHEVQVVLELVNGASLQQHRVTDLNQIVSMFAKVCQGLDALHDLGFVHADMKPNNILVCKDDVIKIIDFGQSCPIGHQKQRIQGTADYIAPEQVERRPLTRQTDVFNLGATLYWVLIGKGFPTRIAKTSADRHDIVDSTPRQHIPTPQEVNAEIPAALSRLVMECCADRPSDRPRDMKQVLSRLDMVIHVLDRRKAGGETDIKVTDVGEEIESEKANLDVRKAAPKKAGGKK